MSRVETALVGREAELDSLVAFLGERNGLPGGVVIEGPAGAGKTTLWRATVDHAAVAGYRVLTCRPAGAEVQLSLAGLSDLLEPHLETVLPGLPPPQRRALEAALLLQDDDGRRPDQRAISAGVLSALRALARAQPILVAIDDAHWLDGPSAAVIAFALRRLRDTPVAVVVTWRTDSSTVIEPGQLRGLRLEQALERPPVRLEVGPLSLGAMQRLVRTRTGLVANRRTLQRIHETSGGNPFYALELARALEHRRATAEPGVDTMGTGEPLPLSAGLDELLAARLDGISDAGRAALFVVAAAARPTVGFIDDVLETSAEAVLKPAIDTGIVRVQGDAIEFAHPLLSAAAYSTLGAHERRRWHARLAGASTDPEARARHLALARPGPDPKVATLLHDAASHARTRGALAAAGELFAEAIDRLPAGASTERVHWTIEAAPILRSIGEARQARALLEAVTVELPAGPLRSDALILLSSVIDGDPEGGLREHQLIDQALAEAGSDPRRRASALLELEAWEWSRDRLADGLVFARQALALAEQTEDQTLLARALTRTADIEVLLGLGGEPVARFRSALEADARVHIDADQGAPAMLAVCLIRAGRLAEARPILLEQRGRASAEGDESSRQQLCLFLAELEWLAGRWDAAADHAREGLEIAEESGMRLRQGSILVLVALIEASRGDPERARSLALEARAICDEVDELAYATYASQVLGFLELSLGHAAAAHEQLASYSVERGIEGSKRLSFIGDEIEALMLLGERERAADLVEELGRRGQTLNRPTLAAVAARGRALVLGSQGELDTAIAAAAESVETYEALGLPFERARSLLVLGEVQRRAKQRGAARATLTSAIEAFDRLGAARWSERAGAERARIGGRSTIEGLSATELRVAELVAEGKSNKEVAAELFVSVRAVEANLSKVYAKLGIRSRTELARRV